MPETGEGATLDGGSDPDFAGVRVIFARAGCASEGWTSAGAAGTDQRRGRRRLFIAPR